MVQIIKAADRGLSTGERISAGIGKALEFGQQIMQQRAQEQQQQEQLQKQASFLKQLGIDPNVLALPPEAQKAYFAQAFAKEKQMTPLQQAQQKLAEAKLKQTESRGEFFKKITGGGEEIQPQGMPELNVQQQQLVQKIPDQNLSQLAAFAGQPGEEGIIGNIAKMELDRRQEEKKERRGKESEFFKMNEPKLAELADTERKLIQEEARYNRLENLFSDPSKFPSTLTAALFSKEGQINDLMYSQLTPEAQESIKLIVDSTSNIKDTYGARVTNFDLQTYLKKLPSLLNSPEGKMRVLRDLKIINRLNQLHANGIQEIFDEAGGSDKIAFSEAQRRYKKRFGSLEKDLIEQFVTPKNEIFKERPNPQKYLGKKIRDEETGEIFISDGIEWKPYKG